MTSRSTGIVLVLLACLLSRVNAADSLSGLTQVTEVPDITNDILLNPGMGLFFMPGRSGDYDKHWYVPIVSVAYFRVDWAALEPEQGHYKFDDVLGSAFDYWLSRGKRVALRVMSSNMHSRREYVSPKWVFDAGVPGVVHKGLYVPRQVDPAFWDPLYIEKQAAFIRALGEKYNGMKGLEFVDLGCVGEWGESHLKRWSSADKEATGYTPMAYTKAYMCFIDLHKAAFPATPLALNCWTGAGHNDVIVDYAVAKGIWLRQDGLTVNYACNRASRYYHQYYQRVKTLYELCFGYRGMAQHGMTALDTFNRGLEDPISYLNLMGTWELSKLAEPDREACRHAARYVGYRLAPVRVQRQDAIHIDANATPRLWLSITWRNLGAAPCYESLAVELALESEAGEQVFHTVDMPPTPTTRWLPKQDIQTRFSLAIGKPIAAGSYRLKVGLADPFEEQRHILLPLKGRDDRGLYPLYTIEAKPRTEPLPQPIIPGSDFTGDHAAKGWWFPKGIKGAMIDDPDVGRCLRIEGKTDRGWNYAGAPALPMLPAAEYVLTAKMKVIAIDDPKKQPYVKMGLVDANGKWFDNKTSSLYDTTKLGSWQELKGRFVTPPNTGGGNFAVEKGGTLPREAVILLADVRLELLSAP